MASIGIIANPSSGKDIRRLVSFATTIDNHEKVNIVQRVVLSAQDLGVDKVYIMADSYNIGHRVIDNLKLENLLKADIEIIDMLVRNDSSDSELAAKKMEALNVGAIVVLGGDGTSRAVAKQIKDTPMLPVSTGTNNVYPKLTEGTVVGMAAAVAATMEHPEKYCIRDKMIEIKKNSEFADLALVDAVVSDDLWSGSKAIWDTRKMNEVFVTRCHPASIGFSAIAGCSEIITDKEPKALRLRLGETGSKYVAPVAAGLMTNVSISDVHEMALDEPYEMVVNQGSMVALDGEREIYAAPGDKLTFTVKKEGPLRVLTNDILAGAVEEGFFSR